MERAGRWDRRKLARGLGLLLREAAGAPKSVTRAGLVGVAVAGPTGSGENIMVEAFVAGRDFLVLKAVAPPAFDAGVARRFFASFAFEPPLRVFSSIAGRYSLLVPDSALERWSLQDDGSPTVVFTLGLPDEDPAILVNATRLPRDLRSAEVADKLKALVSVFKVAPGTEPEVRSIEVHDAPGLEVNFVVLHAKGGAHGYAKGHVFLVGDRVLAVVYLADTPQELKAPRVRDVLDSLRWAAPP
jgi:hypothetical protein